MQKKIKIFLASSGELKEDREQFELFISRQNKQLADKKIFLYLEIWEDFIETMSQTRLQEEYNKAIENSDIFLMLFFTKVGPYTLEEFERAFGQFKKTNRPLIYTFFKKASINIEDIGEEINTLFAFQKRLKELKHFQSSYKNTEHLLHQFDEQLKKLKIYEEVSEPIDSRIKKKAIELTIIPKHDDEFIGREDDLKRLAKELETTQKIVLMNGLGGIGKTTLAKKYVQENLDVYDHIVWIEVKTQDTGHKQNMTITEAFAYNEILTKSLRLEFTNESNEVRFNFIIQALSNLAGKNLLVIDNAREDLNKHNIKDILPRPPHWNILVTSRNSFIGFKTLPINILPDKEAKELFRSHYTKPANDEDIQDLLNEIGYHTLTIELLAKTLSYPGQKLTVKETLQKIRSRQLYSPDLQRRIESTHSEEETEIYIHLIQTFNLSPLTEKEQWLMKQFCFLLPVHYTVEHLENFLDIEQQEKKKELHEALQSLSKKGWLQMNEEGYSIHRVILQMADYQLQPSLKDTEQLINKVVSLLFSDTHTNFTQLFYLVPYAEFILSKLKDNDAENSLIGNLQTSLGIVTTHIGNFEKAKELQESALKNYIKNFGEEHSEVAIVQSNLSLVYQDLGEYEKARDLLEVALMSAIKSFGEDHPKVALRRSNLANVYTDLKEYEKARDLFEAAIASDLKNFGEEHPTIALRRSNLATVYGDLQEYQKARDLLEAALASDLKNFGEDHPTIASHRSNLASVYTNLGEYEKAIDLLEKALISDLKNYGEQHHRISARHNNFAWVYANLKQWEKAKNHFEKAIAISTATFGPDHPYTKKISENLKYVEKKLRE